VSEVRAWPLRAGGPAWTATIVGSDLRLLLAAGGTVIADAGLRGGVTMLDARTGEERWRVAAGSLTAGLGDRMAVWSPGPAGGGELRVAEVATGHTLWSRETDVSLLRAGGGRVVAINFNYRATVYAADTGRLIARDRDLGVDPQSWGLESPDAFTAITVVDDNLYVYGAYEVRAFAVDGVTPLWRAQVGQPLNLFGCAAAAVCVPMPDSMAVLDPATGATRWTDRRFRAVAADGVAADRDGRSARLDPATGRIVRELGPGTVVGSLMLRTDGGRTLVTEDGRVLAVLPGVIASGCRVAGPYLACPTPGRIYAVWRVR
jgi:outer membrane protein assembly factor BamB